MGQLLVTPGAAAGEGASAARQRRVRPPVFFLLALAVGLVAGAGAVVFRWLIGLFHNFLFLGEVSPF